LACEEGNCYISERDRTSFSRFLASLVTGRAEYSRQLAVWFEQIREGTEPTWLRMYYTEFLREFLKDARAIEEPLRAWIAWAKPSSGE
jgi:hypothetical protein